MDDHGKYAGANLQEMMDEAHRLSQQNQVMREALEEIAEDNWSDHPRRIAQQALDEVNTSK